MLPLYTIFIRSGLPLLRVSKSKLEVGKLSTKLISGLQNFFNLLNIMRAALYSKNKIIFKSLKVRYFFFYYLNSLKITSSFILFQRLYKFYCAAARCLYLN